LNIETAFNFQAGAADIGIAWRGEMAFNIPAAKKVWHDKKDKLPGNKNRDVRSPTGPALDGNAFHVS
jgi:hypothetical protein